jgi:hypothetical protein
MYTEDRIVDTGFSFSGAVPAPPDRRGSERLLRILRVGTLIVGARRELCLIRNISAGGLRAHVYTTLGPGDRVMIELKSGQPIPGHVIWMRDADAGIEFDGPVDVTDLLANPAVLENGWRPRMPRVEIDRMATLRAGARTHWVHARDISQGGVKVATDTPPPPDSEVVVALEGLRPLPGVVRWSDGAGCGIAFNQLIPFGELIAWLKDAG